MHFFFLKSDAWIFAEEIMDQMSSIDTMFDSDVQRATCRYLHKIVRLFPLLFLYP